MKTTTSDMETMLLILPLAATVQKRLVNRAADIASKKKLKVLVYCPALSTAPPHSEMSVRIENAAGDAGVKIAHKHASEGVAILEAQNIAAESFVDTQQSILCGALDLVAKIKPSLLMVGASDYGEWSDQSLTESKLLEQCPVPIWIENAAGPDAAVLGAVVVDPGNDDLADMDEHIADEARKTAEDLGATTHVVHALTHRDEMPRAIEMMAAGSVVDSANQDAEDTHARRVHRLAARHQIEKQNVHLERGEPADAVAETARALDASVVVMGASKRGGLTRLLFASPPHRLLEQLHADVLIINRPAV